MLTGANSRYGLRMPTFRDAEAQDAGPPGEGPVPTQQVSFLTRLFRRQTRNSRPLDVLVPTGNASSYQ